MRFDENTLDILSQDVTPKGFTGIEFPTSRESVKLSRFVREIKDSATITSPRVAADYLMDQVYAPFEDFDQEEMWVLLLNTKNRVTHEVMVYRSTVNTAYVRISEVLKEAVRVNAPALILSHCHPSGDPEPSPEDIATTRTINQAARLLHLEVLDHIVVGKDRWVSLKERGVGFEEVSGPT